METLWTTASGETWHNNTKKWTSHILCICVCLHVQNMSQELNPGDPEFLFIQQNKKQLRYN